MTIRAITQTSLLAAMTAVLAQIAIPLPGGVPFTLQIFGIFLGIFLFGKNAFWGLFTYLLLGAIGLPVFAHTQGGIGIILGPTGGYIIGFVISALVGGYIIELGKFSLKSRIWGLAISLIIIYSIGTVQFAVVTNSPISDILAVTILPFIPFDVLKGIIAIILSKYISRALPTLSTNIND